MLTRDLFANLVLSLSLCLSIHDVGVLCVKECTNANLKLLDHLHRPNFCASPLLQNSKRNLLILDVKCMRVGILRISTKIAVYLGNSMRLQQLHGKKSLIGSHWDGGVANPYVTPYKCYHTKYGLSG